MAGWFKICIYFEGVVSWIWLKDERERVDGEGRERQGMSEKEERKNSLVIREE